MAASGALRARLRARARALTVAAVLVFATTVALKRARGVNVRDAVGASAPMAASASAAMAASVIAAANTTSMYGASDAAVGRLPAPGGPLPAVRVPKRAVFVKTHKTGSSTVCATLLHRAMIEGQLPITPAGADTSMHPRCDTNAREPFAQLLSGNRVYGSPPHDLFCMHGVWDLECLRIAGQSLVTGALVATVVREPHSRMMSALKYFGYRWEDPATDYAMGRERASFAHMIRLLYDHSLQPSFTPLDQAYADSTAHQLGYPHWGTPGHYDPANVRAFVEDLDDIFDVVMITERMDDSFALLAEKMGRPPEDMAYLSVRQKRVRRGEPWPTPPQLDELATGINVTMIERLNTVDQAIYEHFSRKFGPDLDRVAASGASARVAKASAELERRCEGASAGPPKYTLSVFDECEAYQPVRSIAASIKWALRTRTEGGDERNIPGSFIAEYRQQLDGKRKRRRKERERRRVETASNVAK